MKHRIEVRGAEIGFDGFLQLKRYWLQHSLYAGGMSRVLVRERVERLRAVAVLLYDPDLDRVVLVEQFRVGALEQDASAWLVEIVGGMWDRDADPEQAARKEAQEEAGCEILDLISIGDVWVSPGTSCERVMLYCGRVNAVDAGGFHGLDHEGEDIRVVAFALQEALLAVEQGRISAATAVLTLQWLALNRERVRERWIGSNIKPS